ncbi:hypothetical protein GCM10011492_01000 [Flexivirga endophytica]|uniref:PIN domain-containing protein n=2 Tax=Flexivirga endophytica TaxID=1849103 RepID=A0A916SSP8_9MICO|nr:hypothetical protein GCM10011492_01000 [Flexivirga endophytica]
MFMAHCGTANRIVAGRILLGQSPAAVEWFARAIDGQELLVSSRLLRTELTRLLRRGRCRWTGGGEITARLATIPVDHATLAGAEAIVPHVNPLDAIHPASALQSGLDDLIIVRHARNMSHVAQQLGFAVFDPVER